MTVRRENISDTAAIIQAERREEIVIEEYSPQRPYLSLPLPSDIKAVESVTFIIEAHDQGWCSVPGSSSWTWFDASLTRPSGRDIPPSQLLRTNPKAEESFTKTTTTWSLADADPGIRNLVASLEAKDTIHVIPKAKFLAWQNHVRMVSVEARCVINTGQPHRGASEPDRAAARPSFYRPLDPWSKEIRLLYLHSGPQDSPLSCRLETAVLDAPDLPNFEALSYCWGSTTSSRPLNVLGGESGQPRTMGITVNLDTALRRLRRPEGMPSRLLWVDAVCINQHDLGERSSQVLIMGTIFTTASSVIIWLGNSDRLALEAIKILHADFTQYQEWRHAGGDTVPPRTCADRMPEGGQVMAYVAALSRFFSYPWFGRVWVVQERWLSRKPVVLCGEEAVSWDSIMMASYWMRNGDGPRVGWRTLPSLWTTIEEGWNDMSPILPTPSTVQDQPATNKRRVKILTLVLGSLELRASDPRDRIFAMLGLGEETSTQDGIPPLLLPDYRKPTSRVYADFTRWWIQTYKKLGVLSAVHATMGRTWLDMGTRPEESLEPDHQHQPRQVRTGEKTPSWAMPDNGTSLWAAQTLGLQPGMSRATGDTAVNLKTCHLESHNERFLVLEGGCVGKIADVGPFQRFLDKRGLCSERRLLEELLREPLKGLSNKTAGKGRIDPTRLESLEDILSTFVQIFDPTGALGIWNNSSTIQANVARSGPEAISDNRHFWHWIDRALESFDRIPDCHFRLEAPRPNIPAVSAAADPYQADSRRAGYNRVKSKLWKDTNTSEDGRAPCPSQALEGLCPTGTRPGDIVVLLYGGDVPFILREQPSDAAGGASPEQDCCLPPGRQAYSLVGECYLEGQMDGKAFEARQGPTPEWFTLV